jgi:hypothetical protein
MKRLLMAWVVLLMVAAGSALGRTWYVEPGGTGDAPTIQAGIDSAAAADTVLLAGGTFAGPGNRDINFGGKGIVVRSESGSPELCIIHCGGTQTANHFGVRFHTDETSASILEGVTIRNAYAVNGAAINCHNSSPRILSCIFEADTATGGGGAMQLDVGSPEISGCTFRDNYAAGYGGALGTSSSSAAMTGCQFSGNTAGFAGGGICCFGGAPTFTACTFRGNYSLWGGGMAFYSGSAGAVDGCISQGNQAQFAGGGFYCFECSPLITGCTFAADSVGFGGAVHLGAEESPTIEATIIAYCKNGCAVSSDLPAATPTLTCCDIYGNETGDYTDCIAGMEYTGGNMLEDPLFCDMPTGNLYVEDCSPCLSDNNGCGIDIGETGQGCLCGQATVPTTWGTIKAMYR